jgi:hypothetical protein
MPPKRIGDLYRERGLLTATQAEQVAQYSQHSGLRFGDAAIDMGLMTREQMIELFGANYKVDFFHLDSHFFPETMKELLKPEVLVQYGVLPLGFKNENSFFRNKRILNVGLLDPSREDAVLAVESALKEKHRNEVDGCKVFLMLADQFLAVLENCYGLKLEDVRKIAEKLPPPGAADQTLDMYLEVSRADR